MRQIQKLHSKGDFKNIWLIKFTLNTLIKIFTPHLVGSHDEVAIVTCFDTPTGVLHDPKWNFQTRVQVGGHALGDLSDQFRIDSEYKPRVMIKISLHECLYKSISDTSVVCIY